MNNHDDSMRILAKAQRRLEAVFYQCAVPAVRQYVSRAISNVEASKRELAVSRARRDAGLPLTSPSPPPIGSSTVLLPATADVFSTFCEALASVHQPADNFYRPTKEN